MEEEMQKIGTNPHADPFQEGAVSIKYLNTNNGKENVSFAKEDYKFTDYGIVVNVAARHKMLIPWGRVLEVLASDRSTDLGDIKKVGWE